MSDVGTAMTPLEWMQRLLAACLDEDLAQEVEARLCEFDAALTRGDVRSLLRATTLIHDAVTRRMGREPADAYCDCLDECIPAAIKTTLQPLANPALHFIWIGSIGPRSLHHIAIWKRANPQSEVCLWFDSGCLLASHYRQLLKDPERLGLFTTKVLLKFQNDAYANIVSGIAEGLTFDEALIRFFVAIDAGEIGRKLEAELEASRPLYEVVARHVRLRDVQQHAATMMDDECRHYYLREIALRANLAAASDILRLHVIRQFGGVYIDCDTLPDLGHAFPRTDDYCRQARLSVPFIDVLKSERYLQKVSGWLDFTTLPREPTSAATARHMDLETITQYLRCQHHTAVDLIDCDLDALTPETAFKPLPAIHVPEEGLLLSADPHNKGCFNNNVIVANANSRAIGIVIAEMRYRYRYLDRMGAIQTVCRNHLPRDTSFKARLLPYRFDALDDDPNVTIVLTGPGLIFEVIMGLGFNLLKLPDAVSPASLAYALYSAKLGIAFTHQTLHTYDHSQSSWMRPSPSGQILV